MAETRINWPARDDARIIGGDAERLDGLAKSTGAAKYTYDVNLKNQLIVRALGCPHAHCRIRAIDASEAERVPGVVHVHVFPHAEPGSEIGFPGELLVAVAAETEAAAAEGVAKLKVDYEMLDVFVEEDDLEAAERAGRASPAGERVRTEREPDDDEDEDEFVEQEIERLLDEAEHVVEGFYGIDAITHCCLEPHGSTVEWQDGKLEAYLSTQNVSGTPGGFAAPLNLTADDVTVHCQYMGGGFGSKFAADYWGIAAAQIARATGRPVKFMLTRDQELKLGGSRPSGYANVRLGADADGVVTVFDSHHWGSAGVRGGGVSHTQMPYVLNPPNFRARMTQIAINAAPARAWRAPNHPQACAMSQTAYDDLAMKMGADSYDVFLKNLPSVAGARPEVYAEEMKIAAELMDWKAKWHPHGQGQANGSVVEGLGMAIHTWGGGPGASQCRVKIDPDGGVESFCGTQDLGTGTKTICTMVVAETLGLPLSGVRAQIGNSKHPFSGPSGGSTTVGGVAESHRRAATDALVRLFERVAPELEASADELEAVDGRIQVRGDRDRSVSWNQACSQLGMQPIEATAQFQSGTPSPLTSSGVGGVQMAHVAVDRETGVVRMKKFVAVQDVGLVLNRKLTISQVHGAMVMGVAFALFEQRILDPATGDFINAELADYHLARLGDIGEFVVHLYEPESERQRGVIGVGEPPVIAPGAAISNAVCNALGVRVPVLPITPKRVLDALANAQGG